MTALRLMGWAGAWGEAMHQQVCEPFTSETGIAIDYLRHIGLRLPETLSASSLDAHGPPYDVVWSNTPPALRAHAQGCCAELSGLVDPAALYRRGDPAIGGGAIVQVYTVPYVLVYRRARFERAPEQWSVLHDKTLAGRIVLYPGGNGFLPIAQKWGGGDVATIPDDMAACWAQVRTLVGQLGWFDYSIGLNERIARGEIDLSYRALPNALGFMRAGLEVDWTVPAGGVADTTDCLWIPRGVGGASAEAARRFIAYAIRPDVQQRWCEALGTLPMVRAARAPSLFTEHARLPDHADDQSSVLFVDERIKAIHEPQWEQTFKGFFDKDGG